MKTELYVFPNSKVGYRVISVKNSLQLTPMKILGESLQLSDEKIIMDKNCFIGFKAPLSLEVPTRAIKSSKTLWSSLEEEIITIEYATKIAKEFAKEFNELTSAAPETNFFTTAITDGPDDLEILERLILEKQRHADTQYGSEDISRIEGEIAELQEEYKQQTGNYFETDADMEYFRKYMKKSSSKTAVNDSLQEGDENEPWAEAYDEWLDSNNKLANLIKNLPGNYLTERIIDKIAEIAREKGELTEQVVYNALTAEEINYIYDDNTHQRPTAVKKTTAGGSSSVFSKKTARSKGYIKHIFGYFDELVDFNKITNIASQLGYNNAKELWKDNPEVEYTGEYMWKFHEGSYATPEEMKNFKITKTAAGKPDGRGTDKLNLPADNFEEDLPPDVPEPVTPDDLPDEEDMPEEGPDKTPMKDDMEDLNKKETDDVVLPDNFWDELPLDGNDSDIDFTKQSSIGEYNEDPFAEVSIDVGDIVGAMLEGKCVIGKIVDISGEKIIIRLRGGYQVSINVDQIAFKKNSKKEESSFIKEGEEGYKVLDDLITELHINENHYIVKDLLREYGAVDIEDFIEDLSIMSEEEQWDIYEQLGSIDEEGLNTEVATPIDDEDIEDDFESPYSDDENDARFHRGKKVTSTIEKEVPEQRWITMVEDLIWDIKEERDRTRVIEGWEELLDNHLEHELDFQVSEINEFLAEEFLMIRLSNPKLVDDEIICDVETE